MANGEINLYGALRSKTEAGKVAFASQIWDETQQKFQDEINQEAGNDGLVSAKVAQSFTDAEKKQARVNLGFGNGDLDDEPIANSDNLVKSGGVDTAISAIKENFNSFVYTDNETCNRFFKEMYIYDADYQEGDQYKVNSITNRPKQHSIGISKYRNAWTQMFNIQLGTTSPVYVEYSSNGNIFRAIVDWSVIPFGSSVSIPLKYRINSHAFDLEYSPTIKLSITKDKMFGKTLVCCGDSITFGADIGDDGIASFPKIPYYWQDGNGDIQQLTSNVNMSYGYQIAKRHNMTFYNAGVNGSMMQGTANAGFSKENGRYTKLPEHIDYLTLFFGWNDAAHGTLGTIDDNTNETFYGSYNIVARYLIENYPYTKICFIVPYCNSANHRNAVRQLAKKWGVACFDMGKEEMPLFYVKDYAVDSWVLQHFKDVYMASAAHPNYKGQTLIADMLEGFLMQI